MAGSISFPRSGEAYNQRLHILGAVIAYPPIRNKILARVAYTYAKTAAHVDDTLDGTRSWESVGMKMSFQDRVIALTGGGQGIGLATARILASRGASVSIADNNPATLAEVEKEFKENDWPVLVTALDVRKGEEVEKWIAATVDKFGGLHGAANIAGTVGKQLYKVPFADIEDEDWNLVMGVNVTGVMNCLRAELRHLADGGSIVNISSTQGMRGGPCSGAYSASKHAVIGLTRCAALDYGSRGIRVNAVAPGGTLTPLMAGVVGGTPPPAVAALGRYGEPEEVAGLISWLLGPESKWVTGEVYRINGGEFC
ncbi:hypothetical protein MBLNU459_g7299t1 [Dothideomycetes sp. NU459]